MRAVLDPNVLISAVLSRTGAPAQVVAEWLAGSFDLVVSDLLLAELERALAYPKIRERIHADDADALVVLLRRIALVARDPAEAPPLSSDPGDDYLLALAAAENALLVTGDKHLLALRARAPILGPREFLDRLSPR